ncbi:hypothetical protein EDD63_10364 [Breznakia blatticola]|uniref:Uncharacterized protein n=1 Tax=Breznakia blatticola TaxID=1754012 RepID=A0A4R8ABF1_9FIRM|nr:hypothetical protein [Breznakia blatticola]TDW25777.1 hypothetical protein EDD63_10364 [Breznakia blatticola]
MYKLLNIKESAMTRVLNLQNQDTLTIDECFDDSALYSLENFDFMKLNELYDCKILLFGKILDSPENNSVVCQIEDTVTIGKRELFKVTVNGLIYYTTKFDSITTKNFYFKFIGKDVIQVNDVIHSSFL